MRRVKSAKIVREIAPDIIKRVAKREDQISTNFTINLFVSYCWRCRPQDVRAIAHRLSGRGYHVFFHVDQQDDKLFEEVQQEIDRCHLFLMFFNEDYEANANCRMEAMYALQTLKKPTLAVNMASKMPTGDWLPLVLQDRAWIDFANEKHIDQVSDEIIERIGRRFEKGDIEGFADHPSYWFKLVGGNTSSASGYYTRPDDEARIFNQILETCQNPGSGALVIAGGGGVGKTTLVSRLVICKRPSNKNIIVFWLNCFQWQDKFGESTQMAFNEKMVSLARCADSSFSGSNFSAILLHFEKDNCHVLFVLDDVFNPDLLQHFINDQTESHLISCVAITRDPAPLLQCPDLTRAVEIVSPLPDGSIRDMLENMYDMKTYVSSDRITKLVQCCCGLPLIASLISARCKAHKNPKCWNSECDIVLNGELRNFDAYEKIGRPFKTVSHLLQSSLRQIGGGKIRRRYNVFLLFDPAVPVSVRDLELLWRLPENCGQTRLTVEQFEQMSLIRRVENAEEESYLVHQMLWEAARDLAFASIKGNAETDKSPLLRAKIIMGSKGVNPYDVVRRKRRALLKLIIDKLDPENLLTFCLQNDTVKEKGCFRTFIHFLYRYEWPGEEDLCNYSYRLISEILLKLKREGGVDLLYRLARTHSKAQNESSVINDSFLLDLFDDELEERYSADRKPVLHILSPCKTYYAETKWKIEVFSKKDRDSQLLGAAILENVDEVKRFAEQNVPMQKAFIAAARCNSGTVIDYLLQKRQTLVLSIDENGWSALHFASQNGHMDIIKQLPVEDQRHLFTTAKRTPLHLAAENGYFDIVRYLLEEHGELLEMTDDEGWSAFHLACKNGHFDIARYLADQTQEQTGQAEQSNELIGQVEENSELIGQDEQDHERTVQSERKHKLIGQVGKDGCTALHLASQNGHLAIARYLLSELGDLVNVCDSSRITALHKAAQNCHFDVVRLLVEEHAAIVEAVDANGHTALHFAAENGHVDVVRFLQQRNPELVKMTDKDGWSAFHFAVANGYLHIVRFLAEQIGEIVTLPNNEGCTALHFAAENGHLDIVRYLLERSPDLLKMGDEQGWTALHLAAQHGHLNVVKHFVEQDRSIVTIAAQNGWTALDSAKQNGHTELVRYLSRMGPNRYARAKSALNAPQSSLP